MPSGSFKYKCELWNFQESPSQKIKGGSGQCTNLLPAKQLSSLLLNSSLNLRGWNLGECVSSYLEANGILMWHEGPKYCKVSNGKCVLLSSLALMGKSGSSAQKRLQVVSYQNFPGNSLHLCCWQPVMMGQCVLEQPELLILEHLTATRTWMTPSSWCLQDYSYRVL